MNKDIYAFIVAFSMFLAAITLVLTSSSAKKDPEALNMGYVKISPPTSVKPKNQIKWASFTPTLEMLEKAYDIQKETKGAVTMWEILAYSVSKNYGNSSKACLDYMDKAKAHIKSGNSFSTLTQNCQYYPYYSKVYSTILKNMTNKEGNLTMFCPIAKGFWFSHYKDFGNKRTYGYTRSHTGNDLICPIGTPVICIEEGYVEALGWNNYGGWRIGIRSLDKKRYYYYAHLRKDKPYRFGLKEGDIIKSGDVIGYVGMTGYSKKENVNNISTPHLHLGLQLIFDESQKDGNDEIWIDVFNIVEFLKRNQREVTYNEEKKEYYENNNG